jgi:hypothetical protein
MPSPQESDQKEIVVPQCMLQEEILKYSPATDMASHHQKDPTDLFMCGVVTTVE